MNRENLQTGRQEAIRGFEIDGTFLECTPCEYYGAAEPPVRCGESHLSGLTEPLRSL